VHLQLAANDQSLLRKVTKGDIPVAGENRVPINMMDSSQLNAEAGEGGRVPDNTEAPTETEDIDDQLDEALLEVLTKRAQAEAQHDKAANEADIFAVVEDALANEIAQKRAYRQDGQQSNLTGGPKSQEHEEQLETVALRRSTTLQHVRPPGAYMAAPGTELQRIDNLRLSLVGSTEPVVAGQGALPSIEGNHQELDEEISTASIRCGTGTGLVEARAVTGSTMFFLQEAQQVAANDLAEASKEQKERQYRTLGCCCIVGSLIALAISLGFGLGTRKSDKITTAPTLSPSTAPSAVPSSAPTGHLDLLFEDLPENTQRSLQNFSAPQRKAWEWLSNHQNITNLAEWRKKQLFALASFFYSFEGENWPSVPRREWMDDAVDECLWFSNKFGQFYVENNEEKYDSYALTYFPDPCNTIGEFQSLLLLGLELSNFSVSIPPETALLTSLSYISMMNSNISAPFTAMLPTELHQLSNLTGLYFDYNSLWGPIPSELVFLSNLTDLFLPENSMTGLLPSELGLMTSLAYLYLPVNSLSGLLPSELGLMTSMIYLDISDNYFSGSLPTDLGEMTLVKYLWLTDNGFTGSIFSEVGDMGSLVDLSMSGNMFSGPIPSELGCLTHLEWLDLSYLPMLSGSLPSELSLLTLLCGLDLRGSSGLSGTIPDEFCYLQNSPYYYVDWEGIPDNYTLDFDCSGILCGCDCPCLNNTTGSNGRAF
jgi:hypothetical protein